MHLVVSQRLVSRDMAKIVDCPHCGVIAGETCLRVRGKPRESQHAERHIAAARTLTVGPTS